MPLDFPNIRIVRSKFGLKRNQAAFESEFSRKISIHCHAGGKTDRWEGLYTTPTLSLADVRVFRSFITQLKGQIGTFKAFNPDKKLPSTYVQANLTGDSTTVSADDTTNTVDSGSFPGAGKVNGASQSGRSLITKDWPASSTVLKAGDHIQVETRFFMVTADVVSDVNGAVTINIEPPLRESPADNAQVVTKNPVLIARLVNPTLQIETGPITGGPYSLAFEEVL